MELGVRSPQRADTCQRKKRHKNVKIYVFNQSKLDYSNNTDTATTICGAVQSLAPAMPAACFEVMTLTVRHFSYPLKVTRGGHSGQSET